MNTAHFCTALLSHCLLLYSLTVFYQSLHTSTSNPLGPKTFSKRAMAAVKVVETACSNLYLALQQLFTAFTNFSGMPRQVYAMIVIQGRKRWDSSMQGVERSPREPCCKHIAKLHVLLLNGATFFAAGEKGSVTEKLCRCHENIHTP